MILGNNLLHSKHGPRNVGIRRTRDRIVGIKVEGRILSHDSDLVKPTLEGEDKPGTICATEAARIHHAIFNMHKINVFVLELLRRYAERSLTSLAVTIESK